MNLIKVPPIYYSGVISYYLSTLSDLTRTRLGLPRLSRFGTAKLPVSINRNVYSEGLRTYVNRDDDPEMMKAAAHPLSVEKEGQ